MVSAENVWVQEQYTVTATSVLQQNSNIVVLLVIYHHVPLLIALKMKYLYTD